MSNIGTAYVQIEPTAKGISKKIEGEMSSAGAAGGNAFSSGFGKVIGGVGKIAIGAVAAGATAVGGIVSAAVKNYGDYEQLAGGIETLFGDSAQTVIDNADRAFQSAGMSANDYMETSIQSAASLINSLGGDTTKAADLMDMSITDMADNVNKMGTNMQSVQDAYRGFSRGNFMMLDNLALGFNGTKEGMQDLLDQAQKISGIKYDISSYSDIVQAIHVVQEEMGITGTTSKEAADTIQGSMASVKAAWDNTLTAIANGDGWDIGVYIENLVDTVETFAGNVMPVVQQALVGVSSLIESLAPEIAAAIPDLITQVLPGLMSAGVSIVESLSQGILSALPQLMPCVMDIINSLLDLILQLAPQLISAGLDIILQLANGITQALPSLIPTITNVAMQIVTMLTDPGMFTSLIQAGIDMLLALADGLYQAIPQLIAALPTIIQNICVGLTQGAPLLIDGAIQLVNMIVQNLPMIMQALIAATPQIIESLVTTLAQNAPMMLAAGPLIMAQLVIGLVQSLPQLVTLGKQLIDSIIQGLASAYANLTAEGPKMLQQLYNRMSPELKKFLQTGRDLVKEIIEGIKGFASNLYNTGIEMMKKLKDKIVSAVKGFAEVGKQIVAGIKEGLASAWEEVVAWFKEKIDALKKSIGNVKDLVSSGDKGTGKTTSESAVKSGGGTTANAIAEFAGSANYATAAATYQTASTNDPMYSLLSQYLPQLVNKKTEVDVEFMGGLDRFFRAMQVESQKNYQLTGVAL